MADGGFELGWRGLAVGESGAEAGVKFVGVSEADDFAEVGGVVAAAGEDDDAVCGGKDEISEDRGAFQGSGFAAGGEDA